MRTIAHELAHAWHQPPPPEFSRAVTAYGEALVLDMARSEEWACLAARDRDERLARLAEVAPVRNPGKANGPLGPPESR
jgi:hypothetical protein